MQIPLTLGAYEGRSSNLNAEKCINFYTVLDREGGKYQSALFGRPGLKEFCDLAHLHEIRQVYSFQGFLFALCGDTLYRITTAGMATLINTVDTTTGHAWMADNGTQLVIVAGTSGYIYEAGVLTQIVDADFPAASSLTYQDGYFIVAKAGTGEIYISGLYDGTIWDALDYATAEGSPDDALAVISDHRELWIMGEQTSEVFINTGNVDFPFERYQGIYLERGIGAAASLAKADNSVFFLDNHGMVDRIDAYTPKYISTRQIDYQISKLGAISDAIGFAYVQEGHTFYVLTFPTGDKTFCYDIATGLWHELTSYVLNDVRQGRWRANCYAFFNNKHIVGDFENGKIYELDFDTYTDNGEPLRSVATTQDLNKDRKRVFFHSLELEFEAGVGLIAGDDPQAMLRWSDNGGHTWSNEHWAGIGKIGEYKDRAIWNRLGQSRNRVFEVAITDAVKRRILAAFVNVSLGVS